MTVFRLFHYVQTTKGFFSSETLKWQEVNRLPIDQKTEQDLNQLLESIEQDSHLLIGQMEEEKEGEEKEKRHRSRN